MKQKVTFLHTSDFHLGASFKGLKALSESWAKRLLSAVMESYSRVIETAIERQVDFVIVAGDVFDTEQTSYADYLGFLKGLERLDEKGIPVYLCMGNHDPLTSWQKGFSHLPNNTSIFSSEKPSFSVFEKDGLPVAVLGGRSYGTKSWPIGEDISAGLDRTEAFKATGVETPFSIGVAHSGLDIDKGHSPLDPAKLLDSGMDYWALGHLHSPFALPDHDPTIVFPGCIQGHDINETGPKGAYLVTLEEGKTNKLEFVSTASVVWQKIKIDISSCSSIANIGERIAQEMVVETSRVNCEEICARVTLVGKSKLKKTLIMPGVLEDLRRSINDSYPLFFCDAIRDKTTLPLEKSALTKEGLFPSVFMQSIEALKNDREKALGFVQEEFLNKKISLTLLQDSEIEHLLDEAEDMVLDLLERSDS